LDRSRGEGAWNVSTAAAEKAAAFGLSANRDQLLAEHEKKKESTSAENAFRFLE